MNPILAGSLALGLFLSGMAACSDPSDSSASGSSASGSSASAGGAEAEPAECKAGAVSDEFKVVGLPTSTGKLDCTVAKAPSADVFTLALDCDVSGDMVSGTIDLGVKGSEPALWPPSLKLGQKVSLESFQDEIDGFDAGYVVRDDAGELVLASVQGTTFQPPGAATDWSAPATLTSVDGVCSAIDGKKPRAIDLELPGATKVRVFSGHAGVIDGRAELRVTRTTYSSEIVGGCNSCVAYVLIMNP